MFRTKNPGTKNNVERTGDRDIAFSELMRRPAGIRTCDFDVMPFCVKCKRPLFMLESKRKFPSTIWAWRHTEYIRVMASDLGIPAYFMHHQPSDEKLTVLLLKPDGDLGVSRTFTYDEYVQWIEKKRDEHVCRK
jgi:hypothetical protein